MRLYADSKLMAFVVSQVLFSLLVSIPALVLHECAHLAVAIICGVKVKKVGFSRAGLFIVREAGSTAANLSISLAGPLLNLLLGATLWNAWPVFAQVNLIIGVFNLLPLEQADGSRISALLFTRLTQLRASVSNRTVSRVSTPVL